MAEISKIVIKLLERTEQGKVTWKTSADERTFVAAVGDHIVTVWSRDPEVVLRILDKNGREIERLDTRTLNLDYESRQLVRLYSTAKDQALGVAGQLDELLKQLEASA